MRNIALVTGADKGIGLQICRQLAQRGYIVILGTRDLANGRQAAASLADIGGDVRPCLIDLTRPETFTDVASLIEADYGRLDALINNAGIALDWEYQADSVPMELIRKTFDVNFFGMVHLTQLLLPLIRRSPAGRIVNQSSRLGSLTLHSTRGTDMDSLKAFAYDTSKTAINSFTVHLAYALRDTPIKVNSAHPGVIRTDINATVVRNANSATLLDTTEGARTAVELATLGVDGPTGGFFHRGERLPW
ncbi:MAG TPA: SDR family oxidoreductase [Verrucomicrobiota bacterium]|nr:SDR family oxidoreductase [Verrucomicrobiota bacterium]